MSLTSHALPSFFRGSHPLLKQNISEMMTTSFFLLFGFPIVTGSIILPNYYISDTVSRSITFPNHHCKLQLHSSKLSIECSRLSQHTETSLCLEGQEKENGTFYISNLDGSALKPSCPSARVILLQVFQVLKSFGFKRVTLYDFSDYLTFRKQPESAQWNPWVRSPIVDLLMRNGNDIPKTYYSQFGFFLSNC